MASAESFGNLWHSPALPGARVMTPALTPVIAVTALATVSPSTPPSPPRRSRIGLSDDGCGALRTAPFTARRATTESICWFVERSAKQGRCASVEGLCRAAKTACDGKRHAYCARLRAVQPWAPRLHCKVSLRNDTVINDSSPQQVARDFELALMACNGLGLCTCLCGGWCVFIFF